MITKDNVMIKLLERVPEYLSTYNEYVEYCDGEILPHVHFGLLVELAVKQCELETLGDKAASEVLQRMMDFIEQALQDDDPYVVNLIAVSFLEHLPKRSMTGVWYSRIEAFLGDKSRRLLNEVNRFWMGGKSGRES